VTAVFSKILIANRSEIAQRITRTCSQMGIATAVVYTEHDARAPFVALADEAVPLPPGSGYLDVDEIVAAAQRVGAEAVHPGYGFLAENAEFAARVGEAGLTFIGPTPGVIATMGSKLASRAAMKEAGVPVLPIAELTADTDARESARAIGFPLVVKASGGGGGKGMRIVESPEALDEAIAGASREALGAFGDATVYLERYVAGGRHIEVQIFGDRHGNVVHLYERECSIQRRFQKVIEEAPAPGLDDGVRSQLWDAAVTAGRAVAYEGAGTVEFIVAQDGTGAFLEMNTRLQVEHPVTEMTTGLDLVRMQIEVANGAELAPQVQLPKPKGHAIEARLYAEAPAAGFVPSTGSIHRFSVSGGVRVDGGVRSGSVVTHHYDPMLAKVIAHAPTRDEAARTLSRALSRAVIHGVDTNRALLVAVLTDDAFLAGRPDTAYLEREADRLIATSARPASEVDLDAGIAALAGQAANRLDSRVLGSLPSGWRNVPSQAQVVAFAHGERAIEVRYTIADVPSVIVDGEPLAIAEAYRVEPDVVDVVVDGIRIRFDIHRVGSDVYVDSVRGSSRFVRRERFATKRDRARLGAMVSRTPGNVVAVPVSVGDVVVEGDTVMIVEAMKMEQSIVAPMRGRVVAVHYLVGEQVEAGSVLAEIGAEDHDDA
jgi:acetyl/propionyl-CoA carboxylase alpha subunit